MTRSQSSGKQLARGAMLVVSVALSVLLSGCCKKLKLPNDVVECQRQLIMCEEDIIESEADLDECLHLLR